MYLFYTSSCGNPITSRTAFVSKFSMYEIFCMDLPVMRSVRHDLYQRVDSLK